jgi:O-antigen/teichoic acid export membrane protein
VRVIGTIGLVVCVGGNLFSVQIMQIFGREYVASAYILRIYAVTNMLVFIVVLFDQFLLAIGHRRQVLYGSLLSLGSAIVLEIVLLRVWGIWGMMLAKIFSMVCQMIFQLWTFRADMRRAALQGFIRLAVPAAVMGIALVATGSLGLLARCLIVVPAVAAAMLAVRVLPPEELRWLRRLQIG